MSQRLHLSATAIVAILGIAGSLLAAWEFAMLVARDPATVARLPAAAVWRLDDLPSWVVLAWGGGITCAALGSAVLLWRPGWAVSALALALAGQAIRLSHPVAGLAPAWPALAGAAALFAYAARRWAISRR